MGRQSITRLRKPLALAIPILAVLALASACNSTDIPFLRNVPWVNIAFGRINGSTNGNIGVDGVMLGYMPCKDHRAPNPNDYTQDPFFGACALPSIGRQPLYDSYADYIRWTGNNTNNPHGIFLGNSTPCKDTSGHWCQSGQTLQHNWANKWTEFHLELYPDDPNATGVRLSVPCCPNVANGGAYTPVIGDVTLPRAGGAGTSRLSAFVGGTSANNQVRLDAFQVDSNPTSRSSTGVPIRSFYSAHNGEKGGGVNAWAAPAVFHGEYAVFITDMQRPHRAVVARFFVPQLTHLQLDRNAPCFGLGEPWDPGQWFNNVRMSSATCNSLWSR
jgi:hypothetical protein